MGSSHEFEKPPRARPTQTAPRKPRKPLGLVLLLAASLAALSFLYYGSQSADTSFYAVCSADGDNVYTVDSENRVTQCLVVAGTDIVDSGSLGV